MMALEQSFRLVKMDTPDPNATLTPFAVTVSRPERLFPKLTPAQLCADRRPWPGADRCYRPPFVLPDVV